MAASTHSTWCVLRVCCSATTHLHCPVALQQLNLPLQVLALQGRKRTECVGLDCVMIPKQQHMPGLPLGNIGSLQQPDLPLQVL